MTVLLGTPVFPIALWRTTPHPIRTSVRQSDTDQLAMLARRVNPPGLPHSLRPWQRGVTGLRGERRLYTYRRKKPSPPAAPYASSKVVVSVSSHGPPGGSEDHHRDPQQAAQALATFPCGPTQRPAALTSIPKSSWPSSGSRTSPCGTRRTPTGNMRVRGRSRTA